jgi:hypothetical protein
VIRTTVVEGPRHAFAPSSFYRRLLEEALGDELVLHEGRHASLEVGSFGPSLLRSVTEGIDSGLSRRRGRLVSPASSLRLRISSLRGDGTTPRIWFTGENVRPPTKEWDLTLSFDVDSLDGTNQYLPLWWGEIGMIDGVRSTSSDRLGREMTTSELMGSREVDTESRRGFVCAFINNPEPMRMRAIDMLRSIGDVDVFGRVSGRPVGPKAQVAARYRYCLCFENDVYPGYVTEKPFEAWASGCIPLWRGLDPAAYLNPSAIINAAEGGLDAMVQRVFELEREPGALSQLAATPILLRKPNIKPVLSRIRNAVTQRTDAGNRAVGGRRSSTR